MSETDQLNMAVERRSYERMLDSLTKGVHDETKRDEVEEALHAIVDNLANIKQVVGNEGLHLLAQDLSLHITEHLTQEPPSDE